MTAKPIHVLHVSPSFYPAIAYGGPIFSTKAITDGIAQDPAFSIDVLSTNTASPNDKSRLSLPENPLPMDAGYQVRFCTSRPGTSISVELLWRLLPAIKAADVVHLTGPYNFPVFPTLVFCRLTRTPLVWSPRGGFQATAQWDAAPKRKIKNAFEKIAAFLAPKDMTLHVTAPVEAQASARNFPRATSAVIPNAITIPEVPDERVRQPDGKLRLVFLSRVHPKKGLDLLVPIMADLPDHVTLDIYGEGADSYIVELTAEIAARQLTDRVRLHGPVTGEAKRAAFLDADVFILPTHSENFGIVVAEALAHGTPVITTVNAPWDGINEVGCGKWVPATPDALIAAILSLDGADLATMGTRGRDWMCRSFSADGMVSAFAALYSKLARKRL